MSLFKVLGAILISANLIVDAYEFRDVKMEILPDGGFEVSIPKNDVKLFAFHGSKNKELKQKEAGTWSTDVTAPTGNRFVYRNDGAGLKPGDRLHYWLYAITHDGLGHELLNQIKKVKGE